MAKSPEQGPNCMAEGADVADINPDKIRDLVSGKKWRLISESLSSLHPFDAAQILYELDDKERVLAFRSLSREFAAELFSELYPQNQEKLLRELSNLEISRILDELPPDDQAVLFNELPAKVTWKLTNIIKPEDMRQVKRILGYPEESVGRLMTPDYISARPDWSAQETIEYIRRKGKDSETISWIYVTTAEGMLLGAVRLIKVIIAGPDSILCDMMEEYCPSISAFEDQESAVHIIKKADASSLPVLDSKGAMVGIVTFDDLMDVEEKEVDEDFHKIAGMSHTPMDDFIDNIRYASVNHLYQKRVLWLVFLIFINVFSGGIAASFEETISKYIVLVFFMPLLIDSGGNAGAQAATLMVRALATGDINQGDWLRMLKKEIFVAGLLGLTMGFAVSFLGVFRGGPSIALVVSVSMMVIVLMGSILGLLLPFILTGMGKDPATSSGPLITSMCDIMGIAIYFSIATWILVL